MHRSRTSAERQAKNFRRFALVVLVAALIGLQLSDADLRAVLAPAVVILAGMLLYFAVQIRREGYMPIFEAATFFVVATAAYSIVPLLQYAAGGMACGPWGDTRLYYWSPSPQEFGGFAWRHATLMTTFVLTYLPLRGKRLWALQRPTEPVSPMVAVIVSTFMFLSLFFLLLRIYSGPGVNVYEGGTGVGARPLPLIVQQLANVFWAVRIHLKQCLVFILLMRWQRRIYRWLLIAWLGAEVVTMFVVMGGRTGTMIVLLTFAVGYHLLVRPMKPAFAILVGTGLLAAILAYGAFRDIHYTGERPKGAVWGSATEFQILYGTAYDLYRKRLEHSLPPIPPQLYFTDFYRVIPSQLLPFYKWDPSDWYLDVLQLRGQGVGLMFGIIAQSVIGFGYYDIVVRAMLLAALYAFAHRVYRRNSRSFWYTMAYLTVLTWAYYAFRSTSFEIIYRFIYYFLPTWALVKFIAIVITKATKRKPYPARA
ncbi:MAG TPA: hypothetical protein VJZ00_01940 [Thermoanaerobaculia bacterium]|nr:hypothetical protein [Thermoanaerobaculia bacterium]